MLSAQQLCTVARAHACRAQRRDPEYPVVIFKRRWQPQASPAAVPVRTNDWQCDCLQVLVGAAGDCPLREATTLLFRPCVITLHESRSRSRTSSSPVSTKITASAPTSCTRYALRNGREAFARWAPDCHLRGALSRGVAWSWTHFSANETRPRATTAKWPRISWLLSSSLSACCGTAITACVRDRGE